MYEISTLPFIKVADNYLDRKCPNELCSPDVPELWELFYGKSVFPLPPFDTSTCLKYLKHCGLTESITPQMIINVIIEIGTKPSYRNHFSEVDTTQLVRARAVLDYLFSCDDELIETIVSFQQKHMKLKCAVKQSFCSYYWLPIQSIPPSDYPKGLPWKGSAYPSHFTSTEVCLVNTHTPNVPNLAGSEVLIVDTSSCIIAPKRLSELGFSFSPTVTDVLNHFTHVRDQKTNFSMEVLYGIVCQIYEFFSTTQLAIAQIKAYQCPWIMVQEGHFAYCDMVAMERRKDCLLIDLTPYNHYCVPIKLHRFSDLFKKCRVEKETTDKQLLMVLHTMKMKGDYTPQTMNIVVFILNSLTDHGTRKVNLHGSILYVPVKSKWYHFELEDATKVVYVDNDDLMCYEIGLDDNIDESEDTLDASEPCLLLHHDVNPKLAACLNVKSLKYHSPFGAEPFGQSENITNRIKTILRDYPFDITVMKELIQNADDAKASKVYFILDMRTHGNTNLLSPEWEDLQGPALLVWNDREFSDQDLKGIQDIGLGSKDSSVESIGQYGIGFNVVYHLTDCPSFITRDRLYILDPYGRYVKSKDTKKPGCSYKVTEKFFNHHYTLKSAYLYSDVLDLQDDIHSGTLFRFPLKKQIQTDSNNVFKVSNTDLVYSMLQEWIKQDLKLTLLFLNHVRELKLCIINDANSFNVFYHCECEFMESVEEKFSQLHLKVKNFTMQDNPFQVQYQVNLLETDYNTKTVVSSDPWIVQRGVGDKDGNVKLWQLIQKIKPQHGIAVPLNPSITPPSTFGQVFCFLPLPVKSYLPVHINGKFCLDSSRRALWTASVPGKCDEKQEWNENLGKAISSSYSALLSSMASIYVSKWNSDEKELKHKLEMFYSLFPNWRLSTHLKGLWLQVAMDVYKSFSMQNACILCQKVITDSGIEVKWHPIKGTDEMSQIYIPCGNGDLLKLFERMGVNITCTPISLLQLFFDVGLEIPPINAKVVFNCFILLCKSNNKFGKVSYPRHIKNTIFQSSRVFALFTKWVLQSVHRYGFEYFEFPICPFKLPLILTADNCLNVLTKSCKILKSKSSSLFPKSKQYFMHPRLVNTEYSTDYYLSPNGESCIIHVIEILHNNLPPEIKEVKHVDHASKYFNYLALRELWTCLSSDPYFRNHISIIIGKWALLLTTNDKLYLYFNDGLLPIILDYEKIKNPCEI